MNRSPDRTEEMSRMHCVSRERRVPSQSALSLSDKLATPGKIRR